MRRTAYDFLPQELACQVGYCDLVAALVGAAAKISPSGRVLFQLFHETAPENGSRYVKNKQQEIDIIYILSENPSSSQIIAFI